MNYQRFLTVVLLVFLSSSCNSQLPDNSDQTFSVKIAENQEQAWVNQLVLYNGFHGKKPKDYQSYTFLEVENLTDSFDLFICVDSLSGIYNPDSIVIYKDMNEFIEIGCNFNPQVFLKLTSGETRSILIDLAKEDNDSISFGVRLNETPDLRSESHYLSFKI